MSFVEKVKSMARERCLNQRSSLLRRSSTVPFLPSHLTRRLLKTRRVYTALTGMPVTGTGGVISSSVPDACKHIRDQGDVKGGMFMGRVWNTP